MKVIGFKQRIDAKLYSENLKIWGGGYDMKRFISELDVSSNFKEIINTEVKVIKYDDWSGEVTFEFNPPLTLEMANKYFNKKQLITI